MPHPQKFTENRLVSHHNKFSTTTKTSEVFSVKSAPSCGMEGILLELLGERVGNLKFHYSTAPNTICIFQNHNVMGYHILLIIFSEFKRAAQI